VQPACSFLQILQILQRQSSLFSALRLLDCSPVQPAVSRQLQVIPLHFQGILHHFWHHLMPVQPACSWLQILQIFQH
jgi:hypothetical protein